MTYISKGLAVATVAFPLLIVAACAQVSAVIGTVSAEAPAIAAATREICRDLLPVAEATADALALGDAAATIQAIGDDIVAPTCDSADTAARAVDRGGD